MLIQELIDELQRVKEKVGNVELLEEVYDGRSINPDFYREFECCFSFKKNAPMSSMNKIKYNRRKADNYWGLETDAVVVHTCTRDDIEEIDEGHKELLEKRGALDLFKPRDLIQERYYGRETDVQ